MSRQKRQSSGGPAFRSSGVHEVRSSCGKALLDQASSNGFEELTASCCQSCCFERLNDLVPVYVKRHGVGLNDRSSQELIAGPDEEQMILMNLVDLGAERSGHKRKGAQGPQIVRMVVC